MTYEQWKQALAQSIGDISQYSEAQLQAMYNVYAQGNSQIDSTGAAPTSRTGQSNYDSQGNEYQYVISGYDSYGSPVYSWERTGKYNQQYDITGRERATGGSALDWQRWNDERQNNQRQLALQQQEFQNSQAQNTMEWQYRQAQLEQNERMEQARIEEQRQQRLATLAAQPKSWIEYAILSNQKAVVQPWMESMLPKLSPFKEGGTLPGFAKVSPIGMNPQDEAAIREQFGDDWYDQRMREKQEEADKINKTKDILLNPSAQLMSRMEPSDKEQYYGYQQYATSRTPEDEQARLWGMAAPSGSNRGLRWSR
jgi:hypothetical protein